MSLYHRRTCKLATQFQQINIVLRVTMYALLEAGHNTKAGGKVVGKRLAILCYTGIASKVPANLHL